MGKKGQKKNVIPSSAFKTCQECDRPFNLFRFRYRCSKCLFCYCKFHLKEIFRESDNKILSLCDICYENYNSIRLNYRENMQDFSESDSSHDEISELASNQDSFRRFSEQEYEVHNRIKVFLAEIRGDQFNFFQERIQSFIRLRCESLCERYNIEKKWVDLVVNVAEEASKTVCPAVAYNEDEMNINKYIKIVKIESTDKTCKFFKSAILGKKFAYKRIPKSIDGCKILLLKGTTWFYLDHKKILSMNELINLEKKYINNLYGIISELNPHIVILEKTMPQSLIKKLEDIKIGVIVNVPMKRINHIARISKGVILNSLVMNEDLKKSLGFCKNFSQVTINNQKLSVFTDEINCLYAGSVVITDPSLQSLKKISKVLKEITLAYRNALIERNFFWQCNISTKENIFQVLDETHKKFKFLSVCHQTVCHFPRDLFIDFYSTDDMPLGKHLISAYLSYNYMCEICNKFRLGEHTFYYVSGGDRVKFYIETYDDKNCYDIMLRSFCNICQKQNSASVYLNQSAWEYSFHKFICNFMTKHEVSHSNFQCVHDALKSSKFEFLSQGFKATLEWEEHSKFGLLPTKTKFLQSSLSHIIQTKFNLITESVTKVLEKIAKSHKSLSDYFLSKNVELSGEFLWLEICSLGEKIACLEREVSKLELSPFETLFSLETYRKYFFSRCCLLKLALENTRINIDVFVENLPVSQRDFESLSFSLIQGPVLDDSELFYSKEYITLMSGHMNLFSELKQKCLSVYENDNSSIISYVLGSMEYYEEIVSPLSRCDDIEENLESEIFNDEDFKFKFKDSSYDYSLYESHSFKQEISKVFGNFFEFSVTVYYVRHFHCLISAICGNFSDFLQSISKSARVASNKKLRITHDSRYVLKSVSENYFKKVLELAPNYFRHENKVIFHNMPSRLLRLLGAFQVTVKSLLKNKTEWVLLQENLASGLPDHVQTYKLLCKKTQDLENKFAKDFYGIPITLSSGDKKVLDAGIWNDSLFLSKQNIINYSLLVKVNFEESLISAGICNYFETYTFEKAIETKYKQALGNEAMNPVSYKEQFRTQVMQNYFMALDD